MSKYKIADLCVEMECLGMRTTQQAQGYIQQEDQPADFDISCNKESLESFHLKQPHLSKDTCEYLLMGSSFYQQLLHYNGVLLHSSAVAVDGKAYLFSAPCSTGKSTHTSLWIEEFGSRAVMINDDKPAIRLTDGRFYTYGTPWSGKTDLNNNIKIPLQAITFIQQSPNNWIRRLNVSEALPLFFEQTVRPRQLDNMEKLLSVLNLLFKEVPVYQMGCTISKEAVHMAYETMSQKNAGAEKEDDI